MKKIKTVAVHSGSFHADEAFAIAILKLLNPNIKIIRTRDPKVYNKVDARIDVGGKYNHKKGDYDHHQREGAGKRKNGIPYASAGLIWKHFGNQLTKYKKSYEYIDQIIQSIDANDVGIKTFTTKLVGPYTMSRIVHSLNPHWPNTDKKAFDREFEKVVFLVSKILRKEIDSSESSQKAKNMVRKVLSKSNKDYIIFDSYMPWKEVVVKESKAKYVIYKDSTEDHWIVKGVPIKLEGFKTRKPFPKKWAGLTDHNLARVTGIPDAKFCHNKRFIATTKSKEGAIKLAKLSLKI